MRAKLVPILAIVFDFDETLIQSNAKINVYRNNKKIKSLSPREFNIYNKKNGEKFDFDEFNDPRLLLNATKYKMWNVLENIYFKIMSGQESSDIFILTTRQPIMINTIYTYLKRNGIIIPEEHIFTVGEENDSKNNMAEKKKNILQMLKQQYDSILFYDDSPENIKLAGELGGIDTILVD